MSNENIIKEGINEILENLFEKISDKELKDISIEGNIELVKTQYAFTGRLNSKTLKTREFNIKITYIEVIDD